jgi:hypothetical protein
MSTGVKNALESVSQRRFLNVISPGKQRRFPRWKRNNAIDPFFSDTGPFHGKYGCPQRFHCGKTKTCRNDDRYENHYQYAGWPIPH